MNKQFKGARYLEAFQFSLELFKVCCNEQSQVRAP